MQAKSVCLSEDQLHRLLIGDLPEDELEQSEAHLLECDQCAQAVSNSDSAEALIDALRSGTATVATIDAHKDETLMSRLRKQGSDRTTVGGQASIEVEQLLDPPQQDDEIGRLGSYRVFDVLGAGGMGVVLRAEDLQLKRQVALKVLQPKLAADPLAKQRFEREAQAMAAVKHDHIVTVYQVGEAKGVPFLAMELLDGEPLDEHMKRIGPLPIDEVIQIGKQVAEALAASHAKGLIHRDIKPGNIWLESSEEQNASGDDTVAFNRFRRAKVLDFGLARAAGDDVSLTKTGAILGTPAYMAPEQAQASGTNARSDLFSLGCVLYHMATGEMPFKGTDVISILSSLANDIPKRPRDLNPLLPEKLNDLIIRLLAKNPDDRPSSAEAVAKELGEVESDDAPTPVKTPASIGRRYRRLAVAAVVLFAVLGPLAYLFGPTVVRFATNKGQIVVKTDDPKIEVVVKQGKVVVIDKTADHTLTLTAGDYDIEVYGSDGLMFRTKQFSITRGGRKVLDVSYEMAQRKTKTPPATGKKFALSFDGKDDYVVFDDLIGSSSTLTLEAWITPQAHDTTLFTMPATRVGIGLQRMELFGEGLRGSLVQNRNLCIALSHSRIGIPLKRRSHVAVTFGGIAKGVSGWRLWFNGKKVFEGSQHYGWNPNVTRSFKAILGCDRGFPMNGNKPASPFRGAIDELRISSDARYLEDFTPPDELTGDKHTVALYHFDEGAGEVLKDSSGHGRHGKIIGAKWVVLEKPGQIAEDAPASGLDPSNIPAIERPVWQAEGVKIPGAELVGILGEHRGGHDRIGGLPTRPNAVGFTTDGKFAVTAAGDGVRLWDVEGMRPRALIPKLRGAHSTRAAVSPVENLLAVGAWKPNTNAPNDQALHLYRIQNGKPEFVRALQSKHEGQMGIECLAFCPDGRRLLTGGIRRYKKPGGKTEDKGDLCLWDVQTGKEIQRFAEHEKGERVHSVVWSLDGNRFASTAARDLVIRIWDAEKLVVVRELQIPNPSANVWLAFSADGKRLYAGNLGSSYVWNVEDGKALPRSSALVGQVVTFKDGKRVAYAGGRRVGVADLSDMGNPLQLPTNVDAAFTQSSLALSWDEKRILTIDSDRGVHLWDANSGKELYPRTGHTARIECMQFSPDGRLLASGSYDGTVRLWDVSGREVKERAVLRGPKHVSFITTVTFSADGKPLSATDRSGRVHFWDVTQSPPKEIRALDNQKIGGNWINAWFNAQENRLIYYGSNAEIRWIDPSGSTKPRKLSDLADQITRTSDGKRMVCASSSGKVQLWDTSGADAQLLREWTDFNLAQNAALHPNGEMLAEPRIQEFQNGKPEVMMHLWDISSEKPKLIAKFEPQPAKKWSAGVLGPQDALVPHFSRDGRTLWLLDAEGRAYAWDVASRKLIHRWKVPTHCVGLAISPDGRHIAVGSSKGAISILRLSVPDNTVKTPAIKPGVALPKDREPLSPITLVTQPAKIPGVKSWTIETRLSRGGLHHCAVFHPKNNSFAIGGTDGIIRLYDNPIDRHIARVYVGHTNQVNSLAFSPDGEILASASDDGSVRLWEMRSGKPLGRSAGLKSAAYAVAWSPDGKHLAVAGWHILGIWDVTSKELPLRWLEKYSQARCLAWSHDGKILAAGCFDKTVRLWNAATGKYMATLEGHAKPLYSLAWSPDDKILASGAQSHDGVRLWDVESRKLKKLFPKCESMAWSPDGKKLAVGGNGQRLQFTNTSNWNTSETNTVGSPQCWSHDGRFLLVRPERESLFDVTLGRTIGVIDSVIEPTSHSWSPDGRTLATGTTGSPVFLWDRDTGKLIRTIRGDRQLAKFVNWSPDGKTLAVRGDVGDTVRLWDVAGGHQTRVLKVDGRVSMAWSPDSTAFAIGSWDKGVWIFDAATGELTRKFEGDARAAVAWSPDGKYLASGAYHGTTIRVWDAASDKLIRTIKTDRSYNFFWSPDSKRLGQSSGTVWDVATGKKVQQVDREVRGWSPDGKLLVSNSFAELRISDAVSGKKLHSSVAHSGWVEASWSPDGKTIASHFRFDGMIRLRDPATGEPRITMLLFPKNEWLAVSAEGHYRGSPLVDKHIVYVVQTEDGARHTLTPAEFARRFGWKNDPNRVRLPK